MELQQSDGGMFQQEHQESENLQLRQEYFSFDEPFMKNLEAMQWNRDNGVVELMPVVVGLSAPRWQRPGRSPPRCPPSNRR
eukprot:589740-Hanusia_phi.AAC.1